MPGLYGFCKNTPQRSQAQVVNMLLDVPYVRSRSGSMFGHCENYKASVSS